MDALNKVLAIFLALFIASENSSNKAHALAGAACELPQTVANNRPDPPGVATKVYVSVYIMDVIEINDASQTFTVEIYVSSRWRDARVSAGSLGYSLEDCRYGLHELWNPGLFLLNARRISRSLENELQVGRDGIVHFRQHGETELPVGLDLRKFPFDRQTLPIKIVSFRYGPDEVAIHVEEPSARRSIEFSIPGWSVSLAERQTRRR